MGGGQGPSCSEKCAKNTMIFINAALTSALGQLSKYSQNLKILFKFVYIQCLVKSENKIQINSLHEIGKYWARLVYDRE